jgi:NAD(P)-dependent dehydrogenase (short-subunit alcohol dehydrogenase family)
VQADVAVESEVLAMFAQVDAAFGPLSALVNNAAVVDVGGGPRVDLPNCLTANKLRRFLIHRPRH